MTTLTPAGLQLLLRLLEAKELIYTHSALAGFHGRPGEDLIASGLLAEAGYEHVVRDDDDDGAMLDVDGDPFQEGLGFHSRVSGFMRVEKLTLLRYAPRIDDLFRLLLGDQLRALPGGPKKLDESGCFWDLGVSRLSRQGLTSVWFGRRLHDLAVHGVLADLMIRSPAPAPRLMLTTTSAKALPSTQPSGFVIIPISDVLAGMAPIAIDYSMLKARFGGQPVEAIKSPVHLSVDGKTLTLNYTVKITFSGVVQTTIIKLLVEAYRQGREVVASELLKKADSRTRTFEQAFGAQWVLLKPYLSPRDGTWAFRF